MSFWVSYSIPKTESTDALRGCVVKLSREDLGKVNVDLRRAKTKRDSICVYIIGELPYKGVEGLVELYTMLNGGVRLEKPSHCSDEL